MRESGIRLGALLLAAVAATTLAASPVPGAAAGEATVRLADNAARQASFDSKTLFKFASAALNIRNIFRNHKEELRDARSKDEKKAIEEKMRKAIHDAIDNAGLSVDTYKRINQAMKNDRQLRQRVTAMIKKMKGTN